MKKKTLRGIDKRTVVHCETHEEAKEVLQIAHEAGYTWCTGESFVDTDDNWDVYGKETAYNVCNGMYGTVETYINNEKCSTISAVEFIQLNRNDIEEIMSNLDTLLDQI